MTKYEVLICIYYYLDREYIADKNKSEEYIYYISNINPDIWSCEGTADPAYYNNYLEICDTFFTGEECSVQDGLDYANMYLEAYNIYEQTHFSGNIDEVVSVFGKCTLKEWKEIYERYIKKAEDTAGR